MLQAPTKSGKLASAIALEFVWDGLGSAGTVVDVRPRSSRTSSRAAITVTSARSGYSTSRRRRDQTRHGVSGAAPDKRRHAAAVPSRRAPVPCPRRQTSRRGAATGTSTGSSTRRATSAGLRRASTTCGSPRRVRAAQLHGPPPGLRGTQHRNGGFPGSSTGAVSRSQEGGGILTRRVEVRVPLPHPAGGLLRRAVPLMRRYASGKGIDLNLFDMALALARSGWDGQHETVWREPLLRGGSNVSPRAAGDVAGLRAGGQRSRASGGGVSCRSSRWEPSCSRRP
jgi:hypothetical protein